MSKKRSVKSVMKDICCEYANRRVAGEKCDDLIGEYADKYPEYFSNPEYAEYGYELLEVIFGLEELMEFGNFDEFFDWMRLTGLINSTEAVLACWKRLWASPDFDLLEDSEKKK